LVGRKRKIAMPFFGDYLISANTLKRLFDLCEEVKDEEKKNEMLIKFKDKEYSKSELEELLELIVDLNPDEINREGEYWRLWWD
jgi:hypothetical protein